MKPEHHDRTRFQVERLILFSDAVFAIAITLLVIDLKIPLIGNEHPTEELFWEGFLEMLPKISGFIVSFFIIGLYWTVHHRIFGYVVNYNQKLLWLNLLFLFSIVLMPFSTAVYSEYSQPQYIHLISPFAVYVFNISFTSFVNLLLWSYITNPRRKLAENLPPAIEIRNGKARSLTILLCFVLSLLLSIWQPGIGRMILLFIPFALKMAVKKDKSGRQKKR